MRRRSEIKNGSGDAERDADTDDGIEEGEEDEEG